MPLTREHPGKMITRSIGTQADSNLSLACNQSAPDEVDPPSSVTRGLDPRVHLLRLRMDCRVKPGNDVGSGSMSAAHASKACNVTPQGGFDVEVENRRGSRGRLRGRWSHLGLCSAEPGPWVFRVARIHRTAG